MRGSSLTLVALLLAAPLVASLPAPSPLVAGAPPPLPADLTDGDLLRLLAAHQGVAFREPTLLVPPDATLERVAGALAARAGSPLTDAQRGELRALDPRVAAPSLTLLLAVQQAWDMRDAAFAAVPPHDQARLRTLDPAGEAYARLAAPADMAQLYAAAILLLDTLEGPVLPALQDAARTVPWPDRPLVDNAALRLGGAGNDTVLADRIVQVDPKGNDVYRNNAGASTLLDPATLVQTPIAVSVDLAGNDRYDRAPTTGGYRPPAQGSGLTGIGVLVDVEGEDGYFADRFSQGASARGVGVLREFGGHDTYTVGTNSAGWSSAGPAFLRDDDGDDAYTVGADSGGATTAAPIVLEDAFGLLWDRAGGDSYASSNGFNDRYGWVRAGGTGWLADEGDSVDVYHVASGHSLHRHGCNDCEWRAGLTDPPLGRGNDNAGGLAKLLAESVPYVSRGQP